MIAYKILKIRKVTETEKYISPERKEDVIEKDKFKGLLRIIDGVNNFHKKN